MLKIQPTTYTIHIHTIIVQSHCMNKILFHRGVLGAGRIQRNKILCIKINSGILYIPDITVLYTYIYNMHINYPVFIYICRMSIYTYYLCINNFTYRVNLFIYLS